jgi:hypothetical protein
MKAGSKKKSSLLTPDEIPLFAAVSEFVQADETDWGEGPRQTVLWSLYLRSIQLGFMARDKGKKLGDKSHRSIFRVLKDSYGRWPTVQDMAVAYSLSELPPTLVEAITRDMEQLRQPVKRRTRHEVFMEKFGKLHRKPSKAKSTTTKE